MTHFEGIAPALAVALEKRGYLELTPVQQAVLAPELDGADALVSAQTGQGIDALLLRLAGLIDDAPPLQMTLGPHQGEALAWLYRHGRVDADPADDEGQVQVEVRLEEGALGRFARQFPGIEVRG